MNVDSESNNQSEEVNTRDNGEEKNEERKNREPILFSQFLESTPPSRTVAVAYIWSVYEDIRPRLVLSNPNIDLFCEDEKCKGLRVFRTSHFSYRPSTNEFTYEHVTYKCSNCMKTEKTYFIALKSDQKKKENGYAYKFGEMPPFGPRTPSKLISLIGPDIEEFLKGRNCESQGLGIGAYAYYRRVVENQKNRILDEIIRAASKLSADDKTISALESAKGEKQFSKAVNLVKEAIPQALLISGQNPLTLLYAALSEGLHTSSDDKCLDAAHDIRIVLAELAERLGQALKDEAELNAAVTRLTNTKARK